MSAQLSITYKPSYEGGEAWEIQLGVLRKAVEHLTRKEVAWELGVTDQALGDALFERDRKRWAAKWTHIVKAMLAARPGDDVACDLLRRLCDSDVVVTSLVVCEPVEMSDEEEAAVARLLERLRRRKAKNR